MLVAPGNLFESARAAPETAKGSLSAVTETDFPFRSVRTNVPSGFASIALGAESMPAALPYSPTWTREANSLAIRSGRSIQ